MFNKVKKQAIVQWYNCLCSDTAIEIPISFKDGNLFVKLIERITDTKVDAESVDAKYYHVEECINDFYNTECHRFLRFDACKEGNQFELLKVAVLLLNALVQTMLIKNDLQIHTLTDLEQGDQEIIQDLMSSVIYGNSPEIKFPPNFSQYSDAGTSKSKKHSPSNKTRAAKSLAKGKSQPSVPSPLMQLFESPVMVAQITLWHKNREIVELKKEMKSLVNQCSEIEKNSEEKANDLTTKDNQIKELNDMVSELTKKREISSTSEETQSQLSEQETQCDLSASHDHKTDTQNSTDVPMECDDPEIRVDPNQSIAIAAAAAENIKKLEEELEAQKKEHEISRQLADFYKEKCDEMKEELEKLGSAIQQMKPCGPESTDVALEKTLVDVKSDLRTKEKELCDMNLRLIDLENDLKRTSEEKRLAETEVKTMTAKFHNVKKNMASMITDCEHAGIQNSISETKVTTLTEQIKKAKSKSTELEKERKELKKEITTLKKGNRLSQTKLEKQLLKFDELAKQLEKVKTNNEAINAENGQLSSELSELKAKFGESTTRSRKSRGRAEVSDITLLRDENLELEKALSTTKESVKSLKKSLLLAEAKADSFAKQNEELNMKYISLREGLTDNGELMRQSTAIAENVNDIASLKDQVQKIKRDYETELSVTNELKSKNAELLEKISSLEELHSIAIAEKVNEIASLADQLQKMEHDYKTELSFSNELKNSNVELLGKISSMEVEKVADGEKVKELDKNIKEVCLDISKLRTSNKSMEKKLVSLRSAKKECENENRALRVENSSIVVEANNKKDKYDELKKRLEEMQMQQFKAVSSSGSKESQSKDAQFGSEKGSCLVSIKNELLQGRSNEATKAKTAFCLNDLQETYDKLLEAFKDSKVEYDALEQQVSQLNDDVTTLKDDNSILKDQRNEVIQELSVLKTERELYNAELIAKFNEEKSTLQNTIEKMEAEIQSLVDRIVEKDAKMAENSAKMVEQGLLISEKDALREELNDKLRKQMDICDRLKKRNEEYSRLVVDCEKLTSEKIELATIADKQHSENEQILAKLKQEEDNCCHLNEELQAAREAFNAEKINLSNKIMNLEEIIEEKSNKITDIQNKVDCRKLRSEKGTTITKGQAYEKEQLHAQLKQQEIKFNNLKDELQATKDTFNVEKGELSEKIINLNEIIDKNNIKIMELQYTVDCRRFVLKEESAIAADEQTLEEEQLLAELKQERSKCDNLRQEIQVASDANTSLNAKISNLEKIIEEKCATIRKLEVRINEFSVRDETAENQLKGEISILTSSLSTLTEELHSEKSRYAEAHSEVEKYKKLEEALHLEIKKLEESEKKLKHDYEELKEKHKDPPKNYEAEVEKLNISNSKFKLKSLELQHTILDKSSIINKMKEKMENLTRQLLSCKQSNQILNKNLKSCSEKTVNLQVEIQKLECVRRELRYQLQVMSYRQSGANIDGGRSSRQSLINTPYTTRVSKSFSTASVDGRSGIRNTPQHLAFLNTLKGASETRITPKLKRPVNGSLNGQRVSHIVGVQEDKDDYFSRLGLAKLSHSRKSELRRGLMSYGHELVPGNRNSDSSSDELTKEPVAKRLKMPPPKQQLARTEKSSSEEEEEEGSADPDDGETEIPTSLKKLMMERKMKSTSNPRKSIPGFFNS